MAGSSVVTLKNISVQGSIQRKVVSIAWIGASDDGSVPDTDIDAALFGLQGWYFYEAKTTPGADTTPTDNYDIVVNDADGIDLAEGLLNDRDETAAELVRLPGHVVMNDLSVVLSNQTAHSATGTIDLVFTAN